MRRFKRAQVGRWLQDRAYQAVLSAKKKLLQSKMSSKREISSPIPLDLSPSPSHDPEKKGSAQKKLEGTTRSILKTSSLPSTPQSTRKVVLSTPTPTKQEEESLSESSLSSSDSEDESSLEKDLDTKEKGKRKEEKKARKVSDKRAFDAPSSSEDDEDLAEEKKPKKIERSGGKIYKEKSDEVQERKDREKREREKKRAREDEEDTSEEDRAKRPRNERIDKEIVKQTLLLAERYKKTGIAKIKEKGFFQPLDPERVQKCALYARERDIKGFPRELFEVEEKESIRVRELMLKVPESERKSLVERIIRKQYGLDVSNSEVEFTYWQLCTFLGLLKFHTSPTISTKMVSNWIEEERKSEKERWSESSPSTRARFLQEPDVEDIDEIAQTPGRWFQFIQAKGEGQANRKRELMKAIVERYRNPIDEKMNTRDKARVLPFSFEVDEHIHVISTLLTPPPQEPPHWVTTQNEHLVLFLAERLEGIRICVFRGFTQGGTFMKLVREEPPSKDKNLKQIARKAETEVKTTLDPSRRVRPRRNSDFTQIAQNAADSVNSKNE